MNSKAAEQYEHQAQDSNLSYQDRLAASPIPLATQNFAAVVTNFRTLRAGVCCLIPNIAFPKTFFSEHMIPGEHNYKPSSNVHLKRDPLAWPA